MPSLTWPDFASIDREVNRQKGNLFNMTWNMPIADSPKKKANLINLVNYGIAADLLYTDKITSLFQKTYARIYGALLSVDTQLTACASPGTLKIS